MRWSRPLLLGLSLVAAMSSRAQMETKTLPKAMNKAFALTALRIERYQEDGENIVKTFRIDFQNSTGEEVQSVDVRFWVEEGGKATFEKTVRLNRFHDNPFGRDGSALPHHRAPTVDSVVIEYPHRLWNTGSHDHFEVVAIHAFAGEGDLHDLGHLFSWLSRAPDEEIVARLKRDPWIATMRFPNGFTALDLALAASTTPVVEAILGPNGALGPVALANGTEDPRVNLAAENEHLGPLAYLVARGAAVDQPNGAGNTALQVALETGHLQNARWLLAHGADPNHRDSQGKTPAFYAGVWANAAELELVAKAGGDLGFHSHGDGLMHMAVERDDPPTLAKLVGLGLSVDDADPSYGRTPLMVAAITQANDAAIWLIEHGANLKAKDAKGHGVLDYARSSNTFITDEFFRHSVLDKLKAPKTKL